MKKLLICILFLLAFGITGCGNGDDNSGENVEKPKNDLETTADFFLNKADPEKSMEALKNAAETEASEFQYFVNEKGTYTISAYNGSDAVVVIPDEINGTAVTDIGSGVFSSNETLKAVRIGNNIEKLDENAFLSCTALKYVIMGDNVKSIGEMCFCACSSLESVQLNDSLEAIEFGAFSTSGDKLVKLEIPENVTSMELAFTQPTVLHVKADSYAAEWVVNFVKNNPADAFEYIIK